MGLFDRFGAGGGKLELQPNARQLSPGQVLDGKVTFTAGTRAQQITHVKLKLTSSQSHTENTPQGPQQRSRSTDVVPEVVLSGPLTTQPGQRYEFPFQLQLPQQMVSTVPNVSSYHLGVSADIDNEIDPGAGIAITIVGGSQPNMMGMPGQMMGGMPGQPMMGGMPGQPMMGGMPGQMMGGMPGQPMMGGMPGQMMGGMAAQPMMAAAQGAAGFMAAMAGGVAGQPGQPAQPMMGGMQQPMMGGMQQPMMGGAIGMGSQVLAQWQDGQFHPAQVVSIQNGYYAVDWHNPQLGATSWVAPNQVQLAPMQGMGQMGQMPQPVQPVQPVMAQPMYDAKQAGGGLHQGAAVWAQSADGNWNPGTIVSIQNGYFAVDWENDKLGATVWVGPTQVKPR